MSPRLTADERIAQMTLAEVYPLYLAKVEKKGRNRDELNQVIEWLTGFNETHIVEFIEHKATLEEFFSRAKINPKAHLITGTVCGCKIEEITNPLTRQVRNLDKLVDELARGWPMEKILRG